MLIYSLKLTFYPRSASFRRAGIFFYFCLFPARHLARHLPLVMPENVMNKCPELNSSFHSPPPHTHLPRLCISYPGGDTTICIATNTRNFPVTVDSVLTPFSQQPITHLALPSPEILPKPSPSLCFCPYCCWKVSCGYFVANKSACSHRPPLLPPSLSSPTPIPLQRHKIQNIPAPCFQSPELLKAVP